MGMLMHWVFGGQVLLLVVEVVEGGHTDILYLLIKFVTRNCYTTSISSSTSFDFN